MEGYYCHKGKCVITRRDNWYWQHIFLYECYMLTCSFKNLLYLRNRIKIYAGIPGWLSWLNVYLLVSTQVMISQFMGSSPALGSVLAVWSLLGILSFSPLSVPTLLALSLSLSLSKINFKKIIKIFPLKQAIIFTIKIF